MNPARFASRHPLLVIALHVGLAGAAATGLGRLRQSDDLLAFIPPGDPDVKVFNDVNEKFGALRVALVGVEAPPGDDVFAPSVLARLEAVTRALKGVRGVDEVLSLTSQDDFVPSGEGVQLNPLIPAPPASAAERAALKAHVMSLDHIVGNLVSPDGRAALLLVFLATSAGGPAGAPPPPLRQIAYQIRSTTEAALGGLRAVYGGVPFATATIYDEAQSDIRRLSPFAALVILLVILIAFRDPVGIFLTVAIVGWAVLVVYGGMGYFGEPSTLVSGTLPVILFASGSSYAVHVLGRYYALRGERGPDRESGRAVIEAVRIVGPAVVIAGCTTAAGFLSFLVMDIAPMRAFGLECALGVLLCLASSLTLVPAVLGLWPRRATTPVGLGGLGAALGALGDFAHRRRLLLLSGAALAALATVGPMLRVEVRMEARSFFRKGSDPWEAERFLDEHFAGSQFLQVGLAGDVTDPRALREVKRLSQFAATLPGVNQVASVVQPIELVSEVMGSGRHLPATRAQTLNLLFFVEGAPWLKRLLTPARDAALVNIRVRGDARPAMVAVEEYLRDRLRAHPGWPDAATVAERLRFIAHGSGGALTGAELDAAVAACRLAPPTDPAVAAALRETALAVLGGEGGLMAPIADAHERERIAAEVAAHPDDGGGARAALLRALPSPEEGGLAWQALSDRVSERRRGLAVARALAPLGARLDPRRRAAMADALLDVLPHEGAGEPPPTLVARIAGEPVLERGMSRSVARNQTLSLVVSMVAVLLLMGLLFRSAWLAFVSVFPAALTMAVVFGAMGLAGIRIDIGTSLVASIATGAGSDFAMHYLWYMRRSTPAEVVRFVGPIMVISTFLVALGFGVLALGKAQPMRLFGSLAGISMALAALLTFLLVPALVGKVAPPSRP